MSKKLLAIISVILVGGIVVSVILFNSHTSDKGGESEAFEKNDNVVYVSANADSKNAAGTFDDPFATIEDARDYLRTKNIDKSNRGVVYLREGTYYITDTVALSKEDSNVTYAAYNGEKVEIRGSTQLDPNKFKKLNEVSGDMYSSKSRLPADVSDKVYVYDLNADGIPVGNIYKNGFNWTKQPLQPELVVNDKLQTLAQYPNDGTVITLANLSVVNEGDIPRNYFFCDTDDSKTYEEMLAMKGPVFCIKSLPDSARRWAGEYDSEKSYKSVDSSMSTDNPLNDNTKYETDGWLSGYFANEYGNDNVKMYSVKSDTDDKCYIYCRYPSMYGVNGSLKVTAVNLLCELDSIGEYYIDRYNGNNILYYYPEGETMVGKSVTLNTLDKPLMTMENAEDIQKAYPLPVRQTAE